MTPPESYVTPSIKELFRPQFATQDPDIYAVLLKTWQDFAEGHIRCARCRSQPANFVATIGFFEL